MDISKGREWEGRERKEKQSEGTMAMDGAKVCDVGRVLVIEGSLICFFIYVKKKDISKGRVWEGEERKGR